MPLKLKNMKKKNLLLVVCMILLTMSASGCNLKLVSDNTSQDETVSESTTTVENEDDEETATQSETTTSVEYYEGIGEETESETLLPTWPESETNVTTLNSVETTSAETVPQITLPIENTFEEVTPDDGGFNFGNTEEDTQETDPTEVIQEPSGYVPESDCTMEPITVGYAYRMLDDREKELYNAIVSAVEKREQLTIDKSIYSEEDWIKIFSCVYYNEPEYFWLDSYLEYGYLKYTTTDENTITQMQEQLDYVSGELIKRISAYPNTVDKIKYIHDYVIATCNFSKEAQNSTSVYGGLIDHVVQCEGYAKTFLYLCNKAGIQSMLITGLTKENASHAWNIVYVDGEWYNIDLTHDDPVLDEPNAKYIRYTYFLVPDEDILDISHFDANRTLTYQRLLLFQPPICNGKKYNYFNYYDQIYADADSAFNNLKEKCGTAIQNQVPMVQIRVENNDIYTTLVGKLADIKTYIISTYGNNVKDVKANLVEESNIVGIILEY